VWRSQALVNWQYVRSTYSSSESVRLARESGKKGAKELLWAPEIQFADGRWVLVHCPQECSALAVSDGPAFNGKWTLMAPDVFRGMHDPSLFRDDDGQWYIVYSNTKIVRLKPDFSGLDGEPVEILPSDRSIGHEGCTIRKIGSKYVLFGTGWSTDRMRKGSYNLYYCVADRVTGPYGERRFAGRFLGHGTPFIDKEGRWWCTAFYNANVPPIPAEGVRDRDLSDNAYTINEVGTTLVPMEIKILPDGDVSIRALDPAYAAPGPDEVGIDVGLRREE
jgi:arylsulfatase